MSISSQVGTFRRWVKKERWSAFYRIGGVAFGVLGLAYIFVAPLLGLTSKATYAPAAGIAAFAVLYVIAQAVERLVEWITDFLKLFPESSGAKKVELTRVLRAANSTLNGNPTLADFGDRPANDEISLQTAVTTAVEGMADDKKTKEKEVDTARTDIRFLAHGLAILLAAIAVTWMNYGILASLGATNFSDNLNRLVTALAAAGGSTALHELISRVQVAKENAQTST